MKIYYINFYSSSKNHYYDMIISENDKDVLRLCGVVFGLNPSYLDLTNRASEILADLFPGKLVDMIYIGYGSTSINIFG